MKTLLLSIVLLAGSLFIHSQTIELPGIGSTNVSIAASQVNTNSKLTFGNPEYKVIGFSLTFPTNNNPSYNAVSINNQFTGDMVTNFQQRLAGADLQLQITLKSSAADAQSWNKSYVVQINGD